MRGVARQELVVMGKQGCEFWDQRQETKTRQMALLSRNRGAWGWSSWEGSAEPQCSPSPRTLSLTGHGLLEVTKLQEHLERNPRKKGHLSRVFSKYTPKPKPRLRTAPPK